MLALAAAFPCLAGAQSHLSPDEARKRLDSERNKLEAKERRGKDLEADVDKINVERERINARLVETAKLVQQSEGQLNLIESRLGELDVQEAHLRETLEARRGSISALLAAMLRMGRNPPPVMVASRKDVLSSFRSSTLLTPVLHELGGEAKALAEQLADLARVMRSIRTEGERLRTETTRLNDARMRLAGLQESKRQSLTERQEELAQVRKAANEISRGGWALGGSIPSLDRRWPEKTGLGSYDREVAAAGPQPGPAPLSDGQAGGPA